MRLPKNCRFDSDEVITNKIGKIVILLTKEDAWSGLKQGAKMFSEDFLGTQVEDFPLQRRTGL